ncbi:MAG: Smr/MutS family protein [Bdellovibrionota bacterium]
MASSKPLSFLVTASALRALEWARLQGELVLRARSPSGQRLAEDWEPGLLSLEETSLQARATLELASLKSSEAVQPPVGDAPLLDDMLMRMTRSGAIDTIEFRSLINFHRGVLDLSQFLRRYGVKIPQTTLLATSLERLEPWFKEHSLLLDPQGEIVDDASEDLAALRELSRELHKKIRVRLEDYLKNNKLAELMQDFYITLRDGRYVLPIKSNFKGRVPGIIHDVSGSEATLFVEPEDVVEWNNQLKLTEKEIQLEIERILAAVVEKTRPHVSAFFSNQKILARMDLVSAFVQLALDVKLPMALAQDATKLDFEALTHPLLAIDRGVVTNSFAWEKAFILTGPNTGGKTVLMKAVGLAVCLARAGFPVFAKGASIPSNLYRIFVSIGDEQNLKENLSTFSAHLKMLAEMFEKSEQGDLVLIDEIATGTSPEEGQPLAQAFIEKLLDRDVRLFVTTHYGALKQFALADPRCRIASMAFDSRSKRPTYQLILDVPGESSAFDTAASVGFPEQVLDRARSLRGEPSKDLTQALSRLEEARVRFFSQEKELSDRLERAQKREEQAQRVVEEYGLKQKIMLSEESQKLIREMSKIRDELALEVKSAQGDEIKSGATKLFQKISDASTQMRVQASDVQELSGQNQSREFENAELVAGTVVEIEGLGMGEIVEAPRGDVQPKSMILVQVGDLKTRVARERLKRVAAKRGQSYRNNRVAQERARDVKAPVQLTSSSSAATGSLLCDVRGKTVEDALRRVEQGLNGLFSGEGTVVTIVHGHGTSRLKEAIRDYLSSTRTELTFRPGSWPGEGGDGVTLVELV